MGRPELCCGARPPTSEETGSGAAGCRKTKVDAARGWPSQLEAGAGIILISAKLPRH